MNTLARLVVFILGTLLPAQALAQAPAVQAAPPTTAPADPALGTLRVAGFSPERVYTDSPDGRAGIARLTALQNERSRAIDERNKTLASQEQALQQNGAVLSEEVRNQKSREIERFKVDVQRMIEDAQAELMGVQRELEAAFLVKLKPVVAQVAKAKGYMLLLNLDADTVAWFDPSLDITSEIVKQLAAQ